MAEKPKWQTYEEISLYLLNQMADEFGLGIIVANQKVVGLRSNAGYKLDGKGFTQEGDKFVILECRSIRLSI